MKYLFSNDCFLLVKRPEKLTKTPTTKRSAAPLGALCVQVRRWISIDLFL
jgi:hypothetical protein